MDSLESTPSDNLLKQEKDVKAKAELEKRRKAFNAAYESTIHSGPSNDGCCSIS